MGSEAAGVVARLFGPLPARERWFVRGRLGSAPLAQLADRAPAGRIADVGCGHGALTALLAENRNDRRVVGIDPDPRKIHWARTALAGLSNVSLDCSTVEALADQEPGAFDAVVVADVLYLLPFEAWPQFLRACRTLLRRSGLLLLKEAEVNRSWKYFKCVAQERLMVTLLGKTMSSGALNFWPRDKTEGLVRAEGFELLASEDLSRGYSTPHRLFVARRGPDAGPAG